MKTRIDRTLNREELAQVLTEIADYFRTGKFELEDRNWQIPEALEVTLKHKEKKGRIKTRLEWQWSTLADYSEADRKEVEQWQMTFKDAKKRLGRSFKEMNRAVKEGRMPTEDELVDAIGEEAEDDPGDHLVSFRSIEEKSRQVSQQEGYGDRAADGDGEASEAPQEAHLVVLHQDQPRLTGHGAEDDTEVEPEPGDDRDQEGKD